MNTYTLKVNDIRKETADTITLCFKQPALRKIKYKAGQYLSLIFRINGRRFIRPYSFSSSPLIDPLIEITVKRVHKGIVSNHIHDKVTIGDSIEVIEPMGDFVFEMRDNIKEIYFWGVGSGITPLISLIKEVINSSALKVNLIYGNRNFDTTIFSNTINNLREAFPDRFKVWHFHTQLSVSSENPDILEGRINKDYALYILDAGIAANTMHYICGPAGLKESVKEALAILDVPYNNIFTEDFEIVKSPKDFEDIITRNINLKFQNEEHVLEIVKGQTILESALDAGLELPYSCQTGNCNTCKAVCLRGRVKMIGISNHRDDLSGDEVLLCCSHPLSADVYIEI
jgi:ring-1,2-phenylacetyl-CoA epoxidase subunit PaaE